MKEQTLEEAANKANGYNIYAKETKAPIFNEGFIAGAKWQQEQAKEMEKEQSLKKIIYDLDELASEYSEGKSTSEVFKRAHESDFKAGFQKAIELLTFKQQEQ